MLETLVTALFLTDPKATPGEREERLGRFFRGVRRDQVKLRDALDQYPTLKRVFLVDHALAEREKKELQAGEASLPPQKRLGKHWSGTKEGLKGMAEAVGLGSDYAVRYRVNSGSMHANRPWDMVRFDPAGRRVIPSLAAHRDLAVPLGCDALRYLAWLLAVAQDCGAVALHQSEQATLEQYRRYLEPLAALLEKGILCPVPPAP
jgi:hypothetical protein